MGITRDPDYPPEAAQLFAAFARCADGFEIDVILDVTINMVVAGIIYGAKARGRPLDEALAYTDAIATNIKSSITRDWNGPPANAVPVPMGQ